MVSFNDDLFLSLLFIRGGHGRTGTLVCIMLHLMYNLNATDAMAYCQRAHDLRQCPVEVGSPQTRSQCDQVRRIVAIMEKQEQRFLRKNGKCGSNGNQYFTFEDCPLDEIAKQEALIIGGEDEEEEEFLCKRMAGKSFDDVEESVVYHINPPNTDTAPPSSSCTSTGSTPTTIECNDTRQQVVNSNSNQFPSPVPSTQPPLKIRLVEKDATRTRNAYTQKVLGQIPMKSLPKHVTTQGNSSKVVQNSIANGKPSENVNTFPVVTPLPVDKSNGKEQAVEHHSKVTSSTGVVEKPSQEVVQAQPPKDNQHRSSRAWKGGNRGIRGQGNGVAKTETSPSNVAQSQINQDDKSDDVLQASTTKAVEEAVDDRSTQKWTIGKSLKNKLKTDKSINSGDSNALKKVVTV